MKSRNFPTRKTRRGLFSKHALALSFLAVLLLGIVPLRSATGEGVTPRLLAEAPKGIRGGVPFTATVVLDLQPGWHTYWQFPGDSGLPPKVEWHLPEGWRAGPLEFSLPRQFTEPGDMVIYGYGKQQLLRAEITPPENLPAGKRAELRASLSWLACKELCVPGNAEVSTVVSGTTPSTQPSLAGSWPEREAPPFKLSISRSHKGPKGESLLLSFRGKENASYELFPNPAEGTSVGRVTRISSGEAAVFSVPWEGQAPFRALLVEQEGAVRRGWWVGEISGTGSRAVSLGVLLAALFSGFLGGLILNLMPCVLPVISLKLFGFVAQAGESPRRILRHGLAFAAGIFFWFLGIGLLVVFLKRAGLQVTWGAFQFQNPLFVVFLSALVFLFALNLLGVFEITLPGAATDSLDRAAARGGYAGSFFQGLFATLLATPCTAPFLGSALGFAFGQGPTVILTMFAAVSAGMALPYVLLSARPGWRRWIPKPGAWMERLKQFMAFPLLATNLWLLWVLERQRGGDAVLFLLSLFLLLGFSAWIFGAVAGRPSRSGRILLLAAAALLTVGAFLLLVPKILRSVPASVSPETDSGIAWVPYSPAALQELRAAGKPVFLDFTASWCLTCQFNERTAIDLPSVRARLRERGIMAMKGDWTNADPAITAALKSFGRVGVPLAVYYPPGEGSAPVILPELLSERIVLETLAK